MPDRTKDVKKAEPRPRFSSAEEYEDFKQRLARRNHARMFNATFSPASLYTTITLDNEHEVHTFAEADGIINPFWRRLRRLNPDAQIALYPGRGKTTSRIHFHMVSNGLTEEQIREKWDGGTIIRIEHLREHNYYNGVDHGRDYTGLANYLFDHWTPERDAPPLQGYAEFVPAGEGSGDGSKAGVFREQAAASAEGLQACRSKNEPLRLYMCFKYVRNEDAAEAPPPNNRKRPLKC